VGREGLVDRQHEEADVSRKIQVPKRGRTTARQASSLVSNTLHSVRFRICLDERSGRWVSEDDATRATYVGSKGTKGG
jgi:hypothetical protein